MYRTPHWAEQSQGSRWLAIIFLFFQMQLHKIYYDLWLPELLEQLGSIYNWAWKGKVTSVPFVWLFSTVRFHFSNVSSNCTGFMMFVSCCWNNWVQFTTEHWTLSSQRQRIIVSLSHFSSKESLFVNFFVLFFWKEQSLSHE